MLAKISSGHRTIFGFIVYTSQRSVRCPIKHYQVLAAQRTMPGPATTLLIEGSFSELADELAKYFDALGKTEPDAGIEADIAPTLAIVREHEQAEEPSDPQTVQKEKDDVLKKLVAKATILNNAPEKGTPQLAR